MRAIQIEEFGGPEVLKVVELPTPEPKPGEVLIRVSKAGMNFADTNQPHAQYVAAQELPMPPGAGDAGKRAATGERVVALTGHGAYAEFAVAPEEHCWPIPDGVE